MAFSRYSRDRLATDGKGLSTAQATRLIRDRIATGALLIQRTVIVTQGDRLDTLAGALYGDSRYWWVLAAASNIGWGLQVPPNTIINVLDLKAVEGLVG